MSFPRYPEYKESGFGWLGRVPTHWDVIRLKNTLAQRITDGPHLTPVFTDEGIPFLSVDSIQGGELDFSGSRFISQLDHNEFSKKVSPQREDILMGKAASTGKIARVKVDFEFSIWSPLALIRVERSMNNPKFVEYVLKSPLSQAEIDVLCTSNTQKNISMDDIPRLRFARPPIEEQNTIANFLDHETAKIDALIAEQEKLIELLKEKRQAVISHAVTKGLDPNVKMKDSGVEWLGQVPEHWEVTRLRRIADRVETGGTPAAIEQAGFFDDGFVWYTPADFGSELVLGKSSRETTVTAVATGDVKVFSPGSVLIVSIGATLGKVRYAKDVSSANQQINAVKPNSLMDGYFLTYMLSSQRSQMRYLANASTIGIMNQEKTKEIWLLVPPIAEQVQIVAHLETSIDHIDRSIKTVQDAITLLLERRSALISAAVTGQIDVRNFVPEAEPA